MEDTEYIFINKVLKSVACFSIQSPRVSIFHSFQLNMKAFMFISYVHIWKLRG